MSEQEEFKIRDSYAARRRKKERFGQVVVYQYDPLPRPFLVQVVHILESAIGSFEAASGRSYVSSFGLRELRSFSPHDVWKVINERAAFAVGEFDIERRERHPRGKFARFLPDAPISTELKLTLIEYAFRVVESLDQLTDEYRQQHGVLYLPAEAVSLLNYQFGQHDLGYRYAAGDIVRMDDELLYQEAVEPAIGILHGAGYEGPLQEFLEAHREHRRGKHKSAVNEALKAFESTMKSICRDRGISDYEQATATKLIRLLVDNNVIPIESESFFTGVRTVLQSGIPTIRNQLSGHGQGPEVVEMRDYSVSFALNITASAILFLVSAHRDSAGNSAQGAANQRKRSRNNPNNPNLRTRKTAIQS